MCKLASPIKKVAEKIT